VDEHDRRLDKVERSLENLDENVTRIRIDLSPLNQKMETMIQRIDFANETQKNKTDKIKEDLDKFVERTEDRLTEQDDNISTLQLSKENKNPFAFWLTNEGIMIAIIGGGVTIISILIEVFMK
jgi:ElaB/YqjD/DUF883 family membrane-anchored ribosome-binding protein